MGIADRLAFCIRLSMGLLVIPAVTHFSPTASSKLLKNYKIKNNTAVAERSNTKENAYEHNEQNRHIGGGPNFHVVRFSARPNLVLRIQVTT